MRLKPLAGLLLIGLGAASLAWPDIPYTKSTHNAKLGPLEFTMKEKDALRIPPWVGLGAVAIGTLLVWRRKG
ncbi:MAG: hypothetical protein HY823_12390 [Acidobacteria bacterium]|nr:hypothetical protein [Acidobacteriota bacterium]